MIINYIMTNILETIINKIFNNNPNYQTTLYQLEKKVLLIHIKDISHKFIFIFNKNKINIVNIWNGYIDCKVYISINELLKIYNKYFIYDINNQNFYFEGDIYILNKLFDLISSNEFNFAIYLAPIIGDFAAYTISNISSRSFDILYQEILFIKNNINQICVEQSKILLGKLEFSFFIKEISLMNEMFETINSRLIKLEIQ